MSAYGCQCRAPCCCTIEQPRWHDPALHVPRPRAPVGPPPHAIPFTPPWWWDVWTALLAGPRR